MSNLTVLERNICHGLTEDAESLFLRLKERIGLAGAERAANDWALVEGFYEAVAPFAIAQARPAAARCSAETTLRDLRVFMRERLFNMRREEVAHPTHQSNAA